MDDLLEVRLRLRDARRFASEMGGAAASVVGFGVASEEAAAKAKLTRVEAFALRQSLFTLRRELFYATAATGAFITGTLKLGLTFDEARHHGIEAFDAITGSNRIANQEMQALIGLTHLTGLQLTTLTDEAIKMQGFGASLHDVNSELSALANFAQRAGLGPGGLSSLVDIFDRIRQSGRLTSLDIRTLTGLGVPALAILQRQLRLTGDQTAALRAGKLVVPSRFALPALTAGIGARAGLLGTNLGQQVGIAHSFLSQIFGGGEQGLLSFATRGLARVNVALRARAQGGSFLGALDPSGRLLLGWHLLEAAVRGVLTPLAVFFRTGEHVARLLSFLTPGLGFLARQTWLVRFATASLATWFLVTRTRMLLFLATTKAVAVAETTYLGILYLLDAASAILAGDWVALNLALEATPLGLIITGVALLGFGLYELVKHAGAVGHAFVVAFGAVKNAVRGALNFIIGAWDWLADHMVVPGFSLGPVHFGGRHLLPHIPRLDEGGVVDRTGLAVVHRGERWSGIGAGIHPLEGGGFVLEQHIYLDGDEITDAVVKTSIRRRKVANGVAQAQLTAAGNA